MLSSSKQSFLKVSIIGLLLFTLTGTAFAQLEFYANDVPDNDPSRKVVFADFDNDGDPDVYVANRTNVQNRLWINDGAANFTPAHISGDNGISYGAAAADVNGDGWLDIYVANDNNQQNRLWINDGNGIGITPTFTNGDIAGDTSYSWGVVMEDFDNDSDIDIYVANNGTGRASRLWINDGFGNFTDGSIPGDNIGNRRTPIAGDIDNDGDLDIYMPKYGQANDLWINDGTAHFTLVNIPGDVLNSREAVMQDLDSDGDLDIYVVNYDNQQNQLWLSNGPTTYTFTNANIVGDNRHSHGAHHGDIDSDGDIDLYVANTNQQNQLWINDGLANFTEFLIPGDTGASVSATMGDLDNDGEMDIFVANADQQNKLWINALDVSVEQSPIQVDPTTTTTAFFDIIFSHAIDPTSFVPGDVNITGLSGSVVSGPIQIGPMDNTQFRVEIGDMTDLDTITVEVFAGAVESALTVGKVNRASYSVDNQVTYHEPLEVSLEQSPIQIDPTTTGTAFFDIIFSHAIDPVSFDASDIMIAGVSGSVISGPIQIGPMDNTQFRVEIGDMTNLDTITVEMLAGSVDSALILGRTNTASYSLDNQVTYHQVITPPAPPSTGGSGGGSVIYVCGDTEALNYSQFGRHQQSLCEYNFDLEIFFEDGAQAPPNTQEQELPEMPSLHTNTCPYVVDYYKKGDTGYGVARIQDFLNKYLGLSLVVDGIFGVTTHNAVEQFQLRHKVDILDPWKLTHTTGRVYKTTQGVMNEIVGCETEDRFLEDVNIVKKFDNDEIFDTFDKSLLEKNNFMNAL